MIKRPRGFLMFDLVRYILLKFIIEKPAHGYELRQKFKQLTGEMWVPSFSMIYPILRELVEFGFVVRKPEVRGKKAMYVYYPTDMGIRAYKEKRKNLAEKIDEIMRKPRNDPHTIVLMLFFVTNLGLIILDDLFGEKKKDILIAIKNKIDEIASRIDKLLRQLE